MRSKRISKTHHCITTGAVDQCKTADEKVGDNISVDLCGDSYTVRSESLETICRACRTLSIFELVSEENKEGTECDG